MGSKIREKREAYVANFMVDRRICCRGEYGGFLYVLAFILLFSFTVAIIPSSAQERTEPLILSNSSDTGSVAGHRPWYLGVSSNLLFDAALVPNLGAEIYLGKGISLKGDYSWGWWSKDSAHRYWRVEGGSLEVKGWLSEWGIGNGHIASGESPMRGHHVGIYGGTLTYDFEFGGKGWLAPRWSWYTGVSYGYSAPIAERLSLDFNIGLGYHQGKYYEYRPGDGLYWWTATKRRRWIGPTRAEVSLVWLIGPGNVHRRKGGAL